MDALEGRPLASSPDESSAKELLRARVGAGNKLASSVGVVMRDRLERDFWVLALIEEVWV
jgi:hypothetical protein